LFYIKLFAIYVLTLHLCNDITFYYKKQCKMKKTLQITVFLSVVLLSSCFAPVTQTYDSARMIKKNELEVRANYSSYSSPKYDGGTFGYKNTNYGISAVYGIENKTNLGLRYEYINNQTDVLDSLGIQSEWITSLIEALYDANRLDFFEVCPKFSLKQDKIAFSAPLALYRLGSLI